jgi:Ser/Thr protein kinase RdoA (MazF antagonist)
MMNKLHEGQVEGTHENLAVLLKRYDITDFTFIPINEGIENSSFRIKAADKEYVLRVYRHKKKPESEIEREINFVRLLQQNQIPVPMVHPTIEGSAYGRATINEKEHYSILMDFVEGASVTTNPSTTLLTELATYQAKMHLLGIEFAHSTDASKKPWNDLKDGIADKIKDSTAYGKEIEAFIERVKKYRYPLNPDLPYGYNHLDIDFDGNVLTKDNHVAAIIDFDDLEYSPTIACLGFTLWNTLDDEGEEAMRNYLHEYEKIRPLTSLEYEILPHVIFFRNYAIGITRLILHEKDMAEADMEDILRLEQEIPSIKFTT